MIVRALIQPFSARIDVTGAIKTTAIKSKVLDAGEELSFNGNTIYGTDMPIIGMGLKLIITAPEKLTETSAGTNYLILSVLTGTDGTTATKTVATFNLWAEDLNRGKEIILPDQLVHRSLGFSISANADNPFTAGEIDITME